MSSKYRIALIHATRVAISPIEEAAKAYWPEAELFSILDEALSIDRASNRVPLDQLNERIIQLAHYANNVDPDGILYTCSAFGRGIERAASRSPLPILKPNEGMFDKALELGDDIVMVYTFQPSVEGMEIEFHEEARRRGSSANIRSILAEGAIEALNAGDEERHNKLVADVVAGIEHADAILLAHFSTARAATVARLTTDIPVLSSPETAIEKMKQAVQDLQHVSA